MKHCNVIKLLLVNNSWKDTAKLNNANAIQGKRKRPMVLCTMFEV
jgi:hypothetical protein